MANGAGQAGEDAIRATIRTEEGRSTVGLLMAGAGLRRGAGEMPAGRRLRRRRGSARADLNRAVFRGDNPDELGLRRLILHQEKLYQSQADAVLPAEPLASL